MNTFKRIQKVVKEAKVDKGRSDYGKATIRNWRHSGPSTVEPAMFDPENKRGKTIDKRRDEHKSRRGVKGAKVPTYTKEDKAPAKVPLKNTGNPIQNAWNKFVPPPESSNNPNVRSGKLKPGKLEAPLLNKMNKTAANINKPIKSVSSIAKVAVPVAAGLAVSKGVDSLMKMGKKKAVKEQNLDELKLFGKKGSGAIFYNDPKGRRDALKTTGKDPGVVNKPAVDNAVKNVKTNVTNKVKSVVTPVQNTVQKSIDTQTNRAGANIGNQISRKVKPAVSSGVSDGIKQGATAVGKAALKGTAAVGAGLAVSKGVDSLMKGGKKKQAKEGYSDWRSDEKLDEYASVGRTVVRQGIRVGGKRGGRAAQGALASGKTAVKHVSANKPGKGEAIGSVVGSLAGGIGGGIAGTPLGGVGAIATGVAGGQVGEKIGGAIGKKFDKKKLKGVKEDYYRGTGEKVQKRTLAWMRKKGQKGAPGLDAMKAREAEHKAKRSVKEEVVDEMNTELSSIKQKYKGKMTKSSVVKRLKDKGESKREFRNSYKKDIDGGYVGPHKPSKSNLKTALKKQSANEEVVNEIAPAIAAVGKMALKAGASAVKQKAKQVVKQKAAQVASGVISQPNMNEGVVDIIKKGAKRHSKAIEKKKIKNRKAVPYAALGAGYEPEGNVIGEEGYDRMRDDRLVKYGIGHDGSDRKGSTYRSTGKQPKGKTVLQKETEKKYGKGVSALDVVKAKIEKEHGKGAIAK